MNSANYEPISSLGSVGTPVGADRNQPCFAQSPGHFCWAASSFKRSCNSSGISGSAGGSLGKRPATRSRRRSLPCPPCCAAAVQLCIRRRALRYQTIGRHDGTAATAAAAAACSRLPCRVPTLVALLPAPLNNPAEAAAREAVEDTLRPRILRYFAFFMICSAGLNVLPHVAAASVRALVARVLPDCLVIAWHPHGNHPPLSPFPSASGVVWSGRKAQGRVTPNASQHLRCPCRWATAWPCWTHSSPSWSRPAAPGCSCCCGWRRRGSGPLARAPRRACWRCCAGESCWRRTRVRRLGAGTAMGLASSHPQKHDLSGARSRRLAGARPPCPVPRHACGLVEPFSALPVGSPPAPPLPPLLLPLQAWPSMLWRPWRPWLRRLPAWQRWQRLGGLQSWQRL